ncbi:hypothetical protein XELAEV_18020145mg [Xenopus laevis]|uniref:Olfactory receptor n=1 Tax=Xenopus laevis TaxID=8355 RepID=A0A974HQ75_XENLA|nr:hypothetical protein XELAEV_18020145mg [Xenopus laevis]
MLFTGVLLMYLLAILGNMIITGLICLAPHLHTPMYFFLCNLAVQDIIYVSSILPKLMAITISGDTSISFSGCLAQMFMFIICVTTEFFLLTFMAYDRYVAICSPLHYFIIMNKRKCIQFASLSWFFGSVNSVFYSFVMCTLPFCTMKEINHFYCDLKVVVKLSCSDIRNLETLMSLESVFLGLIPFAMILASYMYIIRTVLKIRTSIGRTKTFSSCSSHVTVVIIFCGTVISTYMKQESKNSQDLEKLMSLMYSAIVPVLNPLIYSLRNKDVLTALKKIKCFMKNKVFRDNESILLYQQKKTEL